jgi:WASH complex subunit CCDC53
VAGGGPPIAAGGPPVAAGGPPIGPPVVGSGPPVGPPTAAAPPSAAPAAPAAPAADVVMIKDDPRYKKYFVMLRVGVGIPQIQMKMQQDGLDPSVIEYVVTVIFSPIVFFWGRYCLQQSVNFNV